MKLKKNVPMKPWLDWELGFQALTDEQKIGKLNYASHIVGLAISCNLVEGVNDKTIIEGENPNDVLVLCEQVQDAYREIKVPGPN